MTRTSRLNCPVSESDRKRTVVAEKETRIRSLACRRSTTTWRTTERTRRPEREARRAPKKTWSEWGNTTHGRDPAPYCHFFQKKCFFLSFKNDAKKTLSGERFLTCVHLCRRDGPTSRVYPDGNTDGSNGSNGDGRRHGVGVRIRRARELLGTRRL